MANKQMVSIIIPVYNVASYLERCLESCLSQSFFDIEIVAINDGSTDASAEILSKYVLLDSRLRVFYQKNKGVVLARDKGICEANGEWLMFVDGDDYITGDAVEKLLNSVLVKNADIAVGGFFIERGAKIIPQNNSIPFGNGSKNVACALLAEKLQFSLCGKIFNRNLFEKLVVPSILKIGEDAYSVIQLCDKAKKIVVDNFPIYYYVQREGSVMNTPSKVAIHSRILFVELVSKFYKEKEYFNSIDFQMYYGRWVLNEYFSFLRMGGKTKDFNRELIVLINAVYLKNKKSTSLLPLWRVFFLKAYSFSPIAGESVRFIFNKLRVLVRKIEN